MKTLDYSMSARRDWQTYLALLVGMVFTYAGATVDPASNCDASGRSCAPWLVYVAFGMGLLAIAAAVGLWGANRRWGSRLDLAQRQFIWWDTAVSEDPQHIALDAIGRIKVVRPSESRDQLHFYDRQGALVPFTDKHVFPCNVQDWARGLAVHCPDITVEVEGE
jgi:hypothetical protein